MVSDFGGSDWEFFFGVVIVHCLQTYTFASQGSKDKMGRQRRVRKDCFLRGS